MERLSRAAAKSQTRSRLLDAAERLFLAHGYAATPMDKIAEEVGVTKAAIYRHFPSKEDLFLALRERRVRVVDVSPLMAADVSVEQGLTTVAEEVAGLAKDVDLRVLALGLEFRAVSLRRPRARERFAEEIRSLISAAESDDASRVGLKPGVSEAEVVILGQLIVEGLAEYRAFVPDLITPRTFATALKLLASLTEPADHAKSSRRRSARRK